MAELTTRPAISWQPDNEDVITFTAFNIDEQYKNRTVERERPYREGAKLDDTGRGPITWILSVDLFDGVTEDGVDTNQFTSVEPKLFLACMTGKTGFLTLPTRGVVRCKVSNWKRIDDTSERDVAQVQITFLEDNEDDVDFYAFDEFSARSTAQSFANLTVADLGALGISDVNTQSLVMAAKDLEEVSQSPGERLQEVEAKARQLAALCAKVESYYTSGPPGADTITNLLGVPDAYSALRNLRNLRDTAQRAIYEQVSAKPKVKTVRFDLPMSAITVALQTSNTFEDVLSLNKNLLDLFVILPRTPVRVYDR